MRLFSLKRAVPASQAANPHALPERSCHEQPCHENIPYEQCLAEQLHGYLLDLDFPAFALCVCRLLQALGYQDVHLTGRREWKGYNKPGGGGYDLEATLPSSLLPGSMPSRRVIAQIKQFDGLRVHQRSVDELRGTCLRVGAAEALLITTSTFSKVACAGAAVPSGAGSPFAPVRLMDGEELIALLIHYRLGVKECKIKECKTSTVKKLAERKLRERKLAKEKLRDKQWEIDEQGEIDEAFFAELALASAILCKELPTKHQKPAKRQSLTQAQNPMPVQNTTPLQTLTQWRVTVRISSDAKADKQKENEQKKSEQKQGKQKGGG